MFLKSNIHLGFISRFKHRMKQKENLLANLLHIIAPLSVIKVPKYKSILLGSLNLRSGSIFVSLRNHIPAGKAKRKEILAVAVRENV